MEYFKEEREEFIKLSDYQKELTDEKEKRRVGYIIDDLGDVLMERSILKKFMKQFICSGGRYSVNTKTDTFQGIYDIVTKYPMLSKWAVDRLFYVYIKDLFDEYSLVTVLDKFIAVFGQTDDAFEAFMAYVDTKAEELQEKYEESAKSLESLKEEYSKDFVEHLQYLVKHQHIQIEDIKKYLPSSELIKEDEQHILEISTKTRIYFGCCDPVSYTLFGILLETGSLDDYTGEPTYYISTGRKEQAKFTKQEFLDSIQKTKEKKLTI